MHLSRTFAAAATTTLALTFACSSSEPPAELVSPTPFPSTTPAGIVQTTPTPASGSLDDRNCDEFPTQVDAQNFYEEAGGPEQDLHNLDPDRNGRACDESGATTAPGATVGAGAAPTGPVAAPTQQSAVASPREQSHSSGDVDGPEGGSSSYQSCERDGDERCER